MKQAEFIKMVADGAMKFQNETGIFASVTIAQACLETGYGSKLPIDYKTGENSNNLFGVKWNGKGDYVTSWTREVYDGVSQMVKAKFQKYGNVYESIAEHGKLVGYATRYLPVRQATTPEAQARALYECGYATDAPPEIDGDAVYYDKLISIIDKQNLRWYDLEGIIMSNKLDDKVADYILIVLGDYWWRMEGNKEVQDYTHYVANQFRKSLGRPEVE